jgi:anaerobic dimethyl sulfoxide reductase subunit A
MRITTPVSCGKDCGGGCPLLAHVKNGKLTRISNNPAGGPYLKGCINGFQMPRTLYAPDRLLKPVLRTGPRGSLEFKPIGWPEALDRIADKLVSIRDRHGAESILHLGGTGSVSAMLHNGDLISERFLNLFGGCTSYSSNYSSGAAGFVVPYVLGSTPPGFDPGTLRDSKMIILWGANLAVTRMGTAMPLHTLEAKKRGVPIVVIDPRRTDTVRHLGTEWIPCRPGTDLAMMFAVLQVLIQEDLVDWDFIKRSSIGFEQLQRYVMGEQDNIIRSPTWAESICGAPADVITRFAQQYGSIRPTALIPGYSIQRTRYGEDTFRMTIALQVATGNLGISGGSSGGQNNFLPNPKVGKIDPCTPPSQPQVPVIQWPDAVLEGKKGGFPTDIKAIYSVASNFLIQGGDLQKSIRAFNQVEFSVCHDLFMTPTARHCDIVLPATTFLERQDIMRPWAGNYLLFSGQAVPPPGEAKNDYDIFCELAKRLGFLDTFSEGKNEEDWLNSFLAESAIPDPDAFRRNGIFIAEDQFRVGLADFAADPSANPLDTPSGKIELASKTYSRETGFPAIPMWQADEASMEYPLRLITPKSRYRIHSQGSNIPWMREKAAHALEICPQDADLRGIQNGQLVEIYNPQGRICVQALISEDILPGVVCLPEGIWAEFDEQGTEIAGSANMLTTSQGSQPSGANVMHGMAVQVNPAK